jgi:predicted permease
MKNLCHFLARLRAVFSKPALDADFADELAQHLEAATADNIRRGMTPVEAARRARIALGGIEQTRELHRDARGLPWLEDLGRDVRFALRSLAKSPGFTAVAVLTLALGIGANTAIFSVINSALLQPLPYPHPEQLVYVMETMPDGRPNGSVSGGAFKDWREHSSKFADLAVYEDIRRNLTGMGTPERVTGLQASAEFLPTLGVAPMIGRDFAASETTAGGDNQVILLTHQFWQSHYGGDAGVIGRKVSLDQTPYTVIGVLPPRALFEDDIQFLIPEVIDAPNSYWGRDAHWRRVIGRLLPGVAATVAQAELRGIKQRLASEYPAWKEKWSVSVTPLQEVFVGDTRPMFVLLLGAVALVLLIACANVSNLLLARGNARSREMALRVALGAGSWRIVRQMLTESLVLALSGCALGLLLASVSMRLLVRLVAAQLPEVLRPQLNLHVLLFSILVACGCGMLFGLFPACRAAGADVSHALKDSERGSASRSKRQAQSFLVVSEFALTLILLVGAGLFLRSFTRVMDIDPGFNPAHTLAFDLSFPGAKYPRNEDRVRFTRDLIGRIRALPGVESSGAASTLPLSGRERGESLRRPDKPQPSEQYTVGVSSVSGDYFATLGITLLRGRFFTEADNVPTAPSVLVIDTRTAKDLFPDENPIGQRVEILGKSCEIVGVVAPVRHRDLEHQPRPSVYGPQAQFYNDPSIVVRTAVPPAALIETVRKAILAADPEQPIANVRTLEQAVGQSLAPRRTALVLLGLFAAVAISLACIGIYGVISYAIGLRTRELSIRAALGAQRRDITQLVLIGAIKPSLLGIVIGLAAALVMARLVESQLFEVKAHDPLVFVASIGLLGTVAALSVYFPAHRAAKVDPLVALRSE